MAAAADRDAPFEYWEGQEFPCDKGDMAGVIGHWKDDVMMAEPHRFWWRRMQLKRRAQGRPDGLDW